MTAHVTKEELEAVNRLTEKNSTGLADVREKHAKLTGEVEGMKSWMERIHEEQTQGFETVHGRINKQGRFVIGGLLSSLLTFITILGALLVAFVKMNGGG